ncbi:MAG: NGG1p interacting factor NIF3 [Bdellovibrionales bacterium]|nr:NGG1p interacting factor NIF3 [Bdellovibrionales bacterium]
MIQVIVFVPEEHKEKIKQAMFQAGGGKIGNYDSCCFEYAGLGQFRPLQGSQAFVGKVGVVEIVKEVKLEMVCEDQDFPQIIQAMKAAHPYETPAYYGIKTLD